MEDDTRHELDRHEERLDKLNECVTVLRETLAKMAGSADSVERLLRYVVLPLIVIVGGLVGVDIALR